MMLKIKEIKSENNIYNAFLKLESAMYNYTGDLKTYCKKISDNGIVYACYDTEILGLIAFYANDTESKIAYITNIVVSKDTQGKGIGYKLLSKMEESVEKKHFHSIKLEVHKSNDKAISFYLRNGFRYSEDNSESIYMVKDLCKN